MFTEGLFTGRYPSVAPCFKWPYPLAINNNNNNNNISVLLLPSPYLVLLLSQWLLFCSIILAGYVRGLLDAPRCSEMLRDAPRCSEMLWKDGFGVFGGDVGERRRFNVGEWDSN